MWRSTSSNRASGGRTRGFTLLEAMVSLLLLVIILIVAMTMLFQMRAFAERQQYFMLPRQAARRATDYLSYYIAGASDANYVIPTQQSPNALIAYYDKGGVLTQASYNNLTAAQATAGLGDRGTDILTMVAPFNPSRYQVAAPFAPTSATKDLWLNFRVGCGGCISPACTAADNTANLAAFGAATGYDPADLVTGSLLLMLVDKTGSWAYLRIPPGKVLASDCNDTATFNNVNIQADTTATATITPPNGAATLTDPVYLVAGLQVISFRVLTDPVDGVPKLQQKLGLFDPATDNPGTAFTNVMENIEDLQIAYMYADGTIWNTEGLGKTINSGLAGCPQAACDNGVPFQAGPNFPGATPPLDIQNVIGLRFSVTGRSPLLPIGARQLTNITAGTPLAAIPSQTLNQHFRPRSEDHDVDFDTAHPTWPVFDQFDHYRATATLMLRNRTPKG